MHESHGSQEKAKANRLVNIRITTGNDTSLDDCEARGVESPLGHTAWTHNELTVHNAVMMVGSEYTP